ncbi:MAG: hypothetical protein ACREB5_01115 [Sphingomonadaceae bacterium]
MTGKAPPDPAAFFREMLGQWESVANEFGAGMMRTGEFARTMQGANAVSMKAREASHEVMSRALAAANMPSREEVIELGGRMRDIDARLARIEALLERIAGPVERPERPRPKRTRKPPEAKG